MGLFFVWFTMIQLASEGTAAIKWMHSGGRCAHSSRLAKAQSLAISGIRASWQVFILGEREEGGRAHKVNAMAVEESTRAAKFSCTKQKNGVG